MTEIISSSPRRIVFGMLKDAFSQFTIWKLIEVPLAIRCTELPIPINGKDTEELVRQLKGIKNFLIEKTIPESDLQFFQDVIDHYDQVKQISLYTDEEDSVPQEIIDRYIKLGDITEGILAIKQPFNFAQVKVLTRAVHKATGLIKFFISNEKIISGKIVAEIYERKQNLPIATLTQSRKEKDGEHEISVSLFGSMITKQSHIILKEIKFPFYVYRFISEFQQEMVMLSLEPHDIGDYIVTGMIVECDDFKALSDSAKLHTKLPFLFAQTVQNRILQFKDHAEFIKRIGYLEINKTNLFEFPFTLSVLENKQVVNYILLHPKWFKWLIWAWLLHSRKGLGNKYPLHLMWIGVQNSGKSTQFNALHQKSKEVRSIFSGSSSTLKGLIPSFHASPPQLGYLTESNRFAFCDELLRCLIRSQPGKDSDDKYEYVGLLNDLLEHQKRECGSGISSVNVTMTSRVIAAFNPMRGMHNVTDVLKLLPPSFSSRWLIVWQGSDHIDMIRNAKMDDLKKTDYHLEIDDWISIIDYLQSFNAKYDMDILIQIKNDSQSILNDTLLDHYSSRHLHHLECLIDGIIKARCLFKKDPIFNATPEDYEVLRSIWQNIISSWVETKDIKFMDIDRRIKYMPETAQYIYKEICDFKRPVIHREIKDLAETEMTYNEYVNSLLLLIDNGLIIEVEGALIPYWYKENKEG